MAKSLIRCVLLTLAITHFMSQFFTTSQHFLEGGILGFGGCITYGMHLLTLAITLVTSSMLRPMAAAGDCSNDIKNPTKRCMPYLMYPPNPKIPPSKKCCEVVKNSDMQCVCDHVTKEVEKFVSMEKAVYVAGACGWIFYEGAKCGSYKVPPV